MVTYTKKGGAPFVATGTTGGAVTSISNYGNTLINASSAEVFVLDPPVAGVFKRLMMTTTSTAATPIIRGSTGVTVKFNNAGATQLTFTAASSDDATIQLVGVNSTRWSIVGMYPVPTTAAGVTAGTS